MRRRPIASIAAGAALLISLTGCFGAPEKGAAEGAKPSAPKAPTAVELVSAAAAKTKAAAGVKTDFSMRVKSDSEGDIRMKGRMSFRTLPSLAFDQNFREMSVNGEEMPGGMRILLVGKTVYLRMDMLAAATGGKSWIRMPLSELDKNGLDLDALLRQSQGMDPMAQTQMLTSSKDVKQVGKESLDGVQTTHYRGTFDARTSMAGLDAKTRAAVEEGMQGIRSMSFDLWIDDAQLVRKMVMTGEVDDTDLGTGSLKMTMTFREYGEAVEIKKPPSSQVIDYKKIPGLAGGA